ncbi:hypothetical protein [Paraliobacillus salinarum]|uniref:hypothetical protein n=1 Tax=Paraliobacillus salinarum TaxID=1158996 RepID=UPI0015F43F50|nr:hypothetical protein [Paraliobacillus salinarum]
MLDLKNSYASLQFIFEQNLKIDLLAEEIKTCDVTDDAVVVKQQMEKLDFDYFGVTEDEKVIGHVNCKNLQEGIIQNYYKPFLAGDIISDSTSLTEVLNIFQEKDCVYVLEKDRVTKLVTVADLHKQPIRMLAFSLISVLEMSLLASIKDTFPDNTWQSLLGQNRLDKVNAEFKNRFHKNEALSLLDNLQLCDKGTIVKGSESLLDRLGFESKTKCGEFFRKIEKLRNNIAHSQEEIYLNPKELIEVLLELKEVLKKTVIDKKDDLYF